ncbi:ABC1 kinase family protein [Luteolibacter marinus]|uniref:ABC1 kinase family protein n=1 Tax=Luteolibacter marinus TaxID=2776705 RepID=UPI0018661EE0|nr:AarF/UbiB family protein [Luteolibacter marinus]
MKFAPRHLRRYKDVALLFSRYGSGALIDQTGFTDDGNNDEQTGSGHDLAADLENMGPTFVKIGQLLSTRGDLLPPAHLKALARLQDHVEPVPYEEIERVIQSELGVRVSKAFESFDTSPLAAASLGQVHLATLHGGRKVAVKVQRPGIRQDIVDDLDSLQQIAEFLDDHTDFGRTYEIGRLVDQFRSSLLRELDYQREASQLAELRNNLRDFSRLKVPKVVDDYTTHRVLTMDYLPGTKITSLSGAVLTDLDGDVLAEEFFRAYLRQILIDGFFHADPHPGNLLLTHDRDIAILDLGMVGRIQQRMRDQLVHLLAGIAEGDGVQTAEAAMNIGTPRSGEINRTQFINAVEEIVGAARARQLAKIDMGTVVLQVTSACAEAGLRIPAELSLLGKTLMNLDRVGAVLSPGFEPADSIRRHLGEISHGRIKDSLTSANLLGMLTETKDFIGQLPSRLNRILEMVADNKLKVQVDSIDEKALLQGLQKIANRITLGLILAAFIVGSSLLSRIETEVTVFGYPALAIGFFLIASIGSLILLIQILWKDR